MLRYILRRGVSALLSLFIIISLMFCLLRLMPIEGYLGANWEKLGQDVIATKLAAKGLDQPIFIQLARFYRDLFQGSLGESWIYRTNVPVTQIIAPKLKVSFRLGVTAMALALAVGIPLGVTMAQFKGRGPDKMGTGFIILLQAVPSAVYFLFIQMYATSGIGLPMLYSNSSLKSWILPIISLALPGCASYAMWMRRYMVDQMNQDYVDLARVKGSSEKSIMMKHILRNAFVPMVQTLPGSLMLTIMGSLYVESIYSVPGMGGLLIDVIQRQDNTLVQALVLLFSSIGIIGLFLGDILMSFVDPRINLQRGEEGR